MKPTTRIAIAQLLSAAGSVLTAFAAEFNGSEAEAGTATPEGVTPDPEKPKRGRKGAAAVPTVPAQEPDCGTTCPPLAEPAAPTKTYEDMKAVIAPFVKADRGPEVKATIAKFSPSLREMDPKDYAAFEAAIAALPAEKPEEY